jgi:hypothetical protein
MYIKLSRHFHCSTNVRQSIRYLFRCSNPVFSWEELLGSELLNESCLTNLDEREATYDEACPDCSDKSPHPWSGPNFTTNEWRLQNTEPAP